ncbi:MAG: hypothetical protein LBK13_07010, partial [Spirochaetales bacterium]|nr:hypothetical protein [Spirochaetales bacterium]
PVFTQWSEVGGGYIDQEEFTVVPSDVRVVDIVGFVIDGTSFDLDKTDGTHKVRYMYADKDAHVYGVLPYGDGKEDINLILKQGWNSTLWSKSGSNETWVSGGSDGYRWVVD